MSMTDARRATLALLESRRQGTSICPSDVARALAPDADDGWREKMPDVHVAVDHLLDEGLIRLSWKGRPLAERSGPYRIHDARRRP